jgi:hypothetical protein
MSKWTEQIDRAIESLKARHKKEIDELPQVIASGLTCGISYVGNERRLDVYAILLETQRLLRPTCPCGRPTYKGSFCYEHSDEHIRHLVEIVMTHPDYEALSPGLISSMHS